MNTTLLTQVQEKLRDPSIEFDMTSWRHCIAAIARGCRGEMWTTHYDTLPTLFGVNSNQAQALTLSLWWPDQFKLAEDFTTNRENAIARIQFFIDSDGTDSGMALRITFVPAMVEELTCA